MTSTVTATGNVEAGSTVSVSSTGSGKVTKIYVKEGQQVDEGDKLFTSTPPPRNRDLATAKASLASAEASMTTTTQGRSSRIRASTTPAYAAPRPPWPMREPRLRHAQQSDSARHVAAEQAGRHAEDDVERPQQLKADQAALDRGATGSRRRAGGRRRGEDLAKPRPRSASWRPRSRPDQSAIDERPGQPDPGQADPRQDAAGGPPGDPDPARARFPPPRTACLPAGPAGVQPAARPAGSRRLRSGSDRQCPGRRRPGRAGRRGHDRPRTRRRHVSAMCPRSSASPPRRPVPAAPPFRDRQ